MDFAESASKYGLESRSAMRTFIRCLVCELNSTELNVGLVSLKSQVAYTVTKNMPLETQIINRNLVSRMILTLQNWDCVPFNLMMMLGEKLRSAFLVSYKDIFHVLTKCVALSYQMSPRLWCLARAELSSKC